MCKDSKMFHFNLKKDKVGSESVKVKTDFSIKEKCRKIQKKLKKTDNKKTEERTREKKIWWNQCSSRE